MPLEGQHLGHYRLLHLLGSGGMGEVYLAEDARIAQQVAIKVIRTEGMAYPDPTSAKEASRLFEREAKAIARLDHPNILPLYTYGEETINDIPLTYLVMPYRKEGTLATWLRQRGTTDLLSPQEVAYLLMQAADALQHAHDQHILHQDIKPSNFLIRTRKNQLPDLLLADFGIAKFTTATASASQSIRGTPTYMAPEQWDGQPEAATDQYALAIMVYELLTGRPPFQGNLGQIMRQHFQTPPQPPSTLNHALSTAIDTIILRSLAKQPEERFPTVADFAQAFQQAVFVAPAPTLSVSLPASPPMSKDASTLPQKGNDIRSTLVISQDEAMSGTSRTLMLPYGRRTTVTVPAGAYDGQVIHLEGLGEPSSSGGLTGALILTLALQQVEEPDLITLASSTDQTALVSHPDLQMLPPVALPPSSESVTVPSSLPHEETQLAAPAKSSTPDALISTSSPESAIPVVEPSVAHRQDVTQPVARADRQASVPLAAHATTQQPASATLPVRQSPLAVGRRFSRRRTILLIGLALLVVVSGLGLLLYTSMTNQIASNAQTTATAQTNATFAGETVSSQNEDATASAFYANQTAVVVTSTAQVQATQAAMPGIYAQATSRQPILDDPLSSNSQGHQWDENSHCFFSGDGTYHALGQPLAETFCFARKTSFSNFVFQVQMTFVYITVPCGWLVFRAQNAANSVEIGAANTTYRFWFCKYTPPQCRFYGPNSEVDLSCSVNQSNLLAVVAIGDTFGFFINKHYIGSATDKTYSQGQIGVGASCCNAGPHDYDTEIAFSNEKVWTL